MKKKVKKLLKLKENQHNRTAGKIFELAEQLLDEGDFDRVRYFEFCLDVSIIKGDRDYPMLYNERLNTKFWALLDSLSA